jgi:hypothetical protein
LFSSIKSTLDDDQEKALRCALDPLGDAWRSPAPSPLMIPKTGPGGPNDILVKATITLAEPALPRKGATPCRDTKAPDIAAARRSRPNGNLAEHY